MDEVLTVAEIELQCPGEWVLIEDPVTGQDHRVHSGKVLCHSKDRDEVYRKAVEMRPSRFAILCFGRIPKGAAVIL